MTHFLTTSTFSMLALLAVYYMLLQREKMHTFKRFYLLGALVFSLVLPFITITFYTEAVAITQVPVISQQPVMPVTVPAQITPQTDYLPYIGWGIYGVVTLVMLWRFGKNISRITAQAKANTRISYKNAVLVLVEDEIVPHTFLRYIFINKSEYETRCIEPELFNHELAHVTQKHTFDILFIEALKIVLWFNPLLYIYKHAIQLNHEFLADESVLQQSTNVITYQQLLLQRATPKNTFALASSLNFGITKKRFTMMTKTTQKNRALLLKFAALPVLAGLLYGLSTKTVAKEIPIAKPAQNLPAEDSLTFKQKRDDYYSGVRVMIDNQADGIQIDKLFEELTEAEKRNYLFMAPEPYTEKYLSKEEYAKLQNKKGYEVHIDGVKIDNKLLNKYKPADFPFNHTIVRAREALTKAHPQIFQYYLYTHDFYKKHYKGKELKHYPDTVFKMSIYKEYKDDEVVGDKKKLEVNNVHAAIDFLDQNNAPADANQAQEPVYMPDQTEPQPEYPGGINAFRDLIAKNFQTEGLPDGDLKLIVSYIIEKDGTLSTAKIIKETSAQAGKEVLRTIALTEKWKPGQVKGVPVRTSYTLPITIRVKNNPPVKN